MFAEQSASHFMREVLHTQRPVSRTQFSSAGEVADMSKKNVSVDQPGSLTKACTWQQCS